MFWTGSDLIASDEEGDRARRYDVDEARWTPAFLTLSRLCTRPAGR